MSKVVDNVMIKIAGKRHSCECGCNVFHHPTIDELKKKGCEGIYTLKIENVYICNGCGNGFEAE